MMLTPAFDRLPHSAGSAEGRKASQGKQPAVAFSAGAPPEEPQDPATNPISKRLHRAVPRASPLLASPGGGVPRPFPAREEKGSRGKKPQVAFPWGCGAKRECPNQPPKPSSAGKRLHRAAPRASPPVASPRAGAKLFTAREEKGSRGKKPQVAFPWGCGAQKECPNQPPNRASNRQALTFQPTCISPVLYRCSGAGVGWPLVLETSTGSGSIQHLSFPNDGGGKRSPQVQLPIEIALAPNLPIGSHAGSPKSSVSGFAVAKMGRSVPGTRGGRPASAGPSGPFVGPTSYPGLLPLPARGLPGGP